MHQKDFEKYMNKIALNMKLRVSPKKPKLSPKEFERFMNSVFQNLKLNKKNAQRR
jgi:hypothetical protein